MHMKLACRHMEVTEAMRAYVEKKIPRLNKYHRRISEIEVIVDGEGLQHKIEIILKADNHQRFVVSHQADDAYACFDAALDKIERKLVKHKEKTRNHKGRVRVVEATAEIIESQEVEGQDKPSEE